MPADSRWHLQCPGHCQTSPAGNPGNASGQRGPLRQVPAPVRFPAASRRSADALTWRRAFAPVDRVGQQGGRLRPTNGRAFRVPVECGQECAIAFSKDGFGIAGVDFVRSRHRNARLAAGPYIWRSSRSRDRSPGAGCVTCPPVTDALRNRVAGQHGALAVSDPPAHHVTAMHADQHAQAVGDPVCLPRRYSGSV